ncbi:MAG: hypothetical protein F6K04_14955 [Leptolyngbya sp. SIO4C5]|nr:hypothetical protein [Leptolyngbya sp. SIO4C5]
MPYKIYAPVADAASGTDESAAAELKATLFENPEQQARFEQWIRLSRAEALTVPEDRRNDVYARLLDAFESQSDGAIGLGFDRFSNMMGQCSVYPLTIGRRTARFSLLTQANGQPVSPDTDLCGDKGSYWANSAAFPTQEIDDKVRLDDDRAYPFATELAVVYPQCEIETVEAETPCNPGQAFAQMLKTVEGQYLLSEVGLIPVMPIDEIRNILWAGGTDD